MKFRYSVCAAILVVLFFSISAAAITSLYEHPKVASGEIQIRTACMMPVEGKLSKLGMKGREGMSKEAEAWSEELQAVVESHLKLAGVTLLAAPGTTQSNASEEELRQIQLRLQEKYDGISAQMESKPKEIGNSRYTLGDEVTLLPCAAKADVLVFVRSQGQVVTDGKSMFGFLVGGASASTKHHLALTMVDAKSGEILAFVRVNNTGYVGSDVEMIYGQVLDEQFTKLKIGTRGNKAKK